MYSSWQQEQQEPSQTQTQGNNNNLNTVTTTMNGMSFAQETKNTTHFGQEQEQNQKQDPFAGLAMMMPQQQQQQQPYLMGGGTPSVAAYSSSAVGSEPQWLQQDQPSNYHINDGSVATSVSNTMTPSNDKNNTNRLFLGIQDISNKNKYDNNNNNNSHNQGGEKEVENYNQEHYDQENPVDHTDDGENDEDDPVLRQAREAALYAEELLTEEAQQKQTKGRRGGTNNNYNSSKGGPLGFGLLPKAQQFTKTISTNLGGSGTKDSNHKKTDSNNSANNDGSGAAVAERNSNANSIPWYGRRRNTNTTSQYAAETSSTVMTEESGQRWYNTDLNQSKSHKTASEDYGISSSSGTRSFFNTGNDGARSSKGGGGKGAAVMGASAIGGITGLVVLGPLAGIAAAGGMAYAATRDTKVGKGIKGAGGLIAQAGSQVKKVEDQTGIMKSTAKGIGKGIGWVAKKAVKHS